MPITLVPRKDGTWRTCTDFRTINKITQKYRHYIPRLNDILYELDGTCVFFKIDFKIVIINFRLEMAMSGK